MKSSIKIFLGFLISLSIISCGEKVPEPVKATAEEIKIQNSSLVSEPPTFVLMTEDMKVIPGGGCNFDLIAGQSRDLSDISVKQADVAALFTGWAVVSMEDENLGKNVWLTLTGVKKYIVRAERTSDRQDVAAYFKKKELYKSGFKVISGLSNVDVGNYNISILVEGDGAIYNCGIVKSISVL